MTDGATQTLELGSPTPPTPAEATAQLEKLKADPEWTARYLAGNGPEGKQFRDLMAIKSGADTIDRIIGGTIEPPQMETVIGGQLSIRNQVGVAADLKQLGISDAATRQLFEGKPVPKAEYDAVERLRADLFSNSDWVKKYLGDREARRTMTLINIVRAGGVIQGEKAA